MGSMTAEEALKRTVAKVLLGGPMSNEAAEQLATAAKSLFDVAINEYAIETTDGRYSFNEQQSRSASLLAFYLKAAEDVLTDIKVEGRMNTKALTELGYVDHLDRLQNLDLTGGLAYINEIEQNVRQSAILGEEDSLAVWTIMDELKQGYTQVKSGAVSPDSLEGMLSTAKEQLGQLGANTNMLTSTIDLYLENEDVALRYKEAGRAANIILPTAEELEQASGTEYEQMREQLKLSLYNLYSFGQLNKYLQTQMDPGLNRVTVATGMQDTTRLEAHYAQLLTQAELDLYTVSTKDKEAYASIQETLITLGSMLEENLGYMNQAKVRSTYALQHMSVLQLGALSSDNLGINWGGVDPDNNLTEQQRRAIEVDTLASQLTFEFSQGYSSSTAKTLPRVLTGRQNKGLLSASPAYNFFKGFFDAYASGRPEDFENLQENAAYMRDVKRVSSQVMRNGYDSVDSRVNILVDDYVRQLISPESPISSQARFLVSDLST